LTQAVRQVSGEDNEITGASRTDSGAHAKGQVCAFDTLRPIARPKWVQALNDVLPSDLAVVGAQFVAMDFHPRFWATERWYRYRILSKSRDPMRSRYVHEWGAPLDTGAMDRAAQALVGRHDFRAFSQSVPPGANTIREIKSARVRTVRDEVWIDVVATAFVRGMMRRISGALWEVGRGRKPEEWLDRLLISPPADQGQWPPVLPAHGLTLMMVRYGRSPREQIRSDGEDDSDSNTGQTGKR
jgi:tRNA pseudouridine38-40 synthase